MASTSKPRPLSELLKEQQEPFVLKIYLLERGYRPKSIDMTSTYNKANRESCKSSSRQLLHVARKACNKLLSINRVLGSTDYRLSGEKKHGRKQLGSQFDNTVAHESDRISFASSCNSCSESGAMEMKQTCEVDSRTMKLWRVMEDNKECSPVSVLDEIDFIQGFSVFNVRQEMRHLTSGLQKKRLDESIMLNQMHRRSTRQLSVDKANIRQMVRAELISGSTKEWDEWEACKRLIVLEIEDGILEEIMDEIIT